MRISVAVPAYNEERNIGLLIDSLRRQRTRSASIVEIVVVASGCTDGTVGVVEERQRRRGVPVRLIVEPARRGKVAAINTYLRHGNRRVDAICLCSADLIVEREAIERMTAYLLADAEVGMVGARPMPTNGHGTFLGEATRFLWTMHHRVAAESPKVGELALLRAGVVEGPLPEESPVDEASLEQRFVARGYRLAYAADAVAHNHGPETLTDFVRQRRRIAAGHYWLRGVSGYSVATMDTLRVARLTLAELARLERGPALCAVGTIGLEILSRALGYLDYHRDPGQHRVWKVSGSTKSVLTEEQAAALEGEAAPSEPRLVALP